MKSLTSKQAQQLSDLQEKLQIASQKVESAIADFNANINELWGDLVLDSLNEYNNLVKQTQKFTEATTEKLFNYYNSQSNEWQQTEEGKAYERWMDEWDAASFDESDLKLPEETDVPEFSATEAIDALSTQPSL